MDSAQSNPQGRGILLNADIIRVLAIFLAILGPHTAAHLLYEHGIHTRSWMTGNLYDAIGIIGVPMFFMLSGYLILGKQESYSLFFRKRISKVAIPFFVWILIYYVWHMGLYHQTVSPLQWLRLVVTGQVYSHLWFMFVILTLYVLTPLLRKLIDNADMSDFALFASLWALSFVIIPFVQYVLHIGSDLVPLGGMGSGFIYNVVGYTGYYVVGYIAIGAVDKASPKMRIGPYWCLLLVGFLATAIGTYILSLKENQNQLYFYAYFSPSVVLTSIAVVVLLTYYAKRYAHLLPEGVREGLHKLAAVVFGIYFVHIVFLELFVGGKLGFVLNEYALNPLLGIPLFAGILFVVSATVCLLIPPIEAHHIGGLFALIARQGCPKSMEIRLKPIAACRPTSAEIRPALSEAERYVW